MKAKKFDADFDSDNNITGALDLSKRGGRFKSTGELMSIFRLG